MSAKHPETGEDYSRIKRYNLGSPTARIYQSSLLHTLIDCLYEAIGNQTQNQDLCTEL